MNDMTTEVKIPTAAATESDTVLDAREEGGEIYGYLETIDPVYIDLPSAAPVGDRLLIDTIEICGFRYIEHVEIQLEDDGPWFEGKPNVLKQWRELGYPEDRRRVAQVDLTALLLRSGAETAVLLEFDSVEALTYWAGPGRFGVEDD